MAEKIQRYKSDAIAVRYDAKRCIHAAECVRGLPTVFNPRERRWVKLENAGADEVTEIVRRCPTGALHYERNDNGASEPTPNENVIRAQAHGPHYVRGDIRVPAATGETLLSETRAALCRCGASQNKPFCDNSHAHAAFQDAATWRHEVETPNDSAATQSLHVTPTENGSLKVEGEVAIYNAEGALIFHGKKAFLCRCGASQNKPFCDGSHARVGFRAD